jgi:hypothetical protein
MDFGLFCIYFIHGKCKNDLLHKTRPFPFAKVLSAGGHKEMSSILADQQRLIYKPKCRGGGIAGSQLCTWSPNKYWRSNSIFDLWLSVISVKPSSFSFQCVVLLSQSCKTSSVSCVVLSTVQSVL